MSTASLDPRVARGMATQLAARRARLEAGERPAGWKIGFGAPAAMEQLAIDRPLVGFLTDRTALGDGATCSLAGWTRPMLEPEIAVHMARDVGADAGRGDVERAIAGLGAAIELADVDPPPRDVETILAGNIFHRRYVLGPIDRGRRSADGIEALVRRDGAEIARTSDPTAMTGDLLEVVAQAAAVLGACGERLRAGEVVITGSVVPPFAIGAGERIEAAIAPLGTVAVGLAAG